MEKNELPEKKRGKRSKHRQRRRASIVLQQHTGTIKVADFAKIFGIDPSHRVIAERMFSLFDTDNSGDIDVHEFIRGYSLWKEKLEDEADRELLAFNMFDIDGDGMLSKLEFKNMMRATREFDDFHLP